MEQELEVLFGEEEEEEKEDDQEDDQEDDRMEIDGNINFPDDGLQQRIEDEDDIDLQPPELPLEEPEQLEDIVPDEPSPEEDMDIPADPPLESEEPSPDPSQPQEEQEEEQEEEPDDAEKPIVNVEAHYDE